jgi:hypothetical protein
LKFSFCRGGLFYFLFWIANYFLLYTKEPKPSQVTSLVGPEGSRQMEGPRVTWQLCNKSVKPRNIRKLNYVNAHSMQTT